MGWIRFRRIFPWLARQRANGDVIASGRRFAWQNKP
jgi:hypothetical protein